MNHNPTNQLDVCLVIDKKPGHANISRGIATALATKRSIRVIEYYPRSLTYSAGKLLQRIYPFGYQLVHTFLNKPAAKMESFTPQIIVGSGGNTLWHTAALAYSYGAISYFAGSERHLPKGAISTYLHYDSAKTSDETILHLPIFPANFTLKGIKQAWNNLEIKKKERSILLLIGGDGSGYYWKQTDINYLTLGLSKIAYQLKYKLLICTSRRTPKWLEEQLILNFPNELLLDTCYYHQGDARKVIQPYLGGADIIIVTEDSMSMIHEALSSFKKTFTIRPNKAQPNKSYANFIINAQNNGWLKRLLCTDLNYDCVFNSINNFFSLSNNLSNSCGELIYKNFLELQKKLQYAKKNF